MIYHLGAKSMSILGQAHHDLQVVLIEAIKDSPVDFSVVEAHRSGERQNQLFEDGMTKARAGQSPHNRSPSLAVDIVPWPTGYSDESAMVYLAGHVMGTAKRLGIDLKWGGDWNRDAHLSDERFKDYPHFELAGWREMPSR